MSDSTDPRPPSLPALRRDPLAGQVEPVELDESLERYQRDLPRGEPIRRRSRSRWMLLAILGITAVFAHIRFFHIEKPIISSDTVPAGWDDLGECSTTTSIDGQKWLTLSSDQTAELTDRSKQATKNNAAEIRSGKWAHDELVKKYLVTFDGQTTSYSIWSLEGVATCILVSGSFENANLRESWFSASDEKFRDNAD